MQNADIQAELDKAVERANTGLRRFEKTYEGAKLN